MASERQSIESKLQKGARIANQTINASMNKKDALRKFTDSVKRYLEAQKIYGGYFESQGLFKVYGNNQNYFFEIDGDIGNFKFDFRYSSY